MLNIFIMAGGTGERFWPMSRVAKPKHLLRLLGEKTLLEEAVGRALKLVDREDIFVLTNASQRDACAREVAHLIPDGNLIAEPAKRDTAPAAALATGIARSRNPEAICALFPADAMIHDADMFRQQVAAAADALGESDALLTFAIPPTGPATAFGYLELGDKMEGDGGLYRVERFVEKPDADRAEEYVASGRFFWNAGMFMWHVDGFLKECRRLLPPLADFIEAFPASEVPAFLDSRFGSLPKISVDYAIMEQARDVVAVRAQFDWDDVGSWTALPAHLGVDGDRNTLRGGTAVLDSFNNIVLTNSRTVALCGVSDLVVVETEDAVLVCHRNSAQRIKNLQPLLPEALR